MDWPGTSYRDTIIKNSMENSLQIYNKPIENIVELRYLGINATQHGKFGINCPHKSNEVLLKKKG